MTSQIIITNNYNAYITQHNKSQYTTSILINYIASKLTIKK